jgi:hypothetical protein
MQSPLILQITRYIPLITIINFLYIMVLFYILTSCVCHLPEKSSIPVLLYLYCYY